MRRRTLDIVFSSGGVLLAGLLMVLGLMLTSNANFARSYVADQLAEQNITFTPAEALGEEEAQADCLVEYAGQQLTTGKQAECYANEYIGLHLSGMADGMSYAELGAPQRELQGELAAAQEAGDPAAAEIEAELEQVTADRETLFKGETLRGLLLTTYGFSIFGEKAAQAGTVLFAGAALMMALSAAGFVHAFATPRDKKVRIPGLEQRVIKVVRPKGTKVPAVAAKGKSGNGGKKG